jgi:polyisoprenoid-binding protein YceI
MLCLLLAACGAPPIRPPEAPAPPAGTPAPRQPSGAGAHFRIDAAHSELRILVYRAGPMAALGHNHVISTHAVQGWATLSADPAAVGFALRVPVADFAVDDAGLRAQEGADFAENVTDEAKSGTLHNMLGPAVLNAVEFPALTLRSTAVTGTGHAYQARIALQVAGHASTLVVPFVLDASPGRLVASGELTVSQSDLGLTPFSIFLGALKVKDEMRVRFKFVAVAG